MKNITYILLLLLFSCNEKAEVVDELPFELKQIISQNKGYKFVKLDITKELDKERKQSGISIGNGCIKRERIITYYMYVGDYYLNETVEVNNAILYITGSVKKGKLGKFTKTDCKFSKIIIRNIK